MTFEERIFFYLDMRRNPELSSSNLMKAFGKKFRTTYVRSDDAEQITAYHSEVFQHLFDSLFVAGSYPWESDTEPKILFQLPDKGDVAKSFLPFLFPSPQKRTHLDITDYSMGLNYLFYTEAGDNYSFESLYFPQNTDCPYLFVMRYDVTPLTMPTFAHELDFKDLLLSCNPECFPKAQICICVRTKFPYYTLFKSFFEWIIQAENVGRIEILPKIDGYLSNKSYDFSTEIRTEENGGSLLVGERVWPDNQRQIMKDSLIFFLITMPPERNATIEYDSPPLPLFKWTRPDVEKSYRNLAIHCMHDVAKYITPDILMLIYSALCLERTIIIYHPTISIVCNFVMACHFILRPFRWAGSSIAPLPKSLNDFLNSPTPIIIGIIDPLEEIQDNNAYLNLQSKKFKVSEKLPLISGHDELKSKLSEHWACLLYTSPSPRD